MDDIEKKYMRLKDQIREYKSLVIAYSGGIDSALLLRVATEVLGKNAIGVMADSASVPRKEITEAKRVAGKIGANMMMITTEETYDENYIENPTNRCYFCKSELFHKLFRVAQEKNIRYIASGTNIDDLGDFRPGLQAADEQQVKSPLRDAGFTKSDIRELAKRLDLDVWDKPASPCLASRIPYGNPVTVQKLAQIEEAEDYLKGFSIRELRVRHFGKKARIEVNKPDLGKIEDNLFEITKRFREIGFQELDYQEFKSGALNALINAQG
ncbi:MAG: ATP-dependent sacrificial sulfur transferase LarE [Calditrichaeota bacterium]|nr:ATP-dependent sacrificial sulfur transferase LarE [Calditrichota bacterium]